MEQLIVLNFGCLIADVEIPADAKVYTEVDKSKADRIIIRIIKNVGEHKCWRTSDFCLAAC